MRFFWREPLYVLDLIREVKTVACLKHFDFGVRAASKYCMLGARAGPGLGGNKCGTTVVATAQPHHRQRISSTLKAVT